MMETYMSTATRALFKAKFQSLTRTLKIEFGKLDQ